MMPVTHWIYPTTARANYYWPSSSRGTAGHRSGARRWRSNSSDDIDPWLLRTGPHDGAPGDAVWFTPPIPYQYICAVAKRSHLPQTQGRSGGIIPAVEGRCPPERCGDPIPRSAFGQIDPAGGRTRGPRRTAAGLGRWRGSATGFRLTISTSEPNRIRRRTPGCAMGELSVQRQGGRRTFGSATRGVGRRCAGDRAMSAEAVLRAAHIDRTEPTQYAVTKRGACLLRRRSAHPLRRCPRSSSTTTATRSCRRPDGSSYGKPCPGRPMEACPNSPPPGPSTPPPRFAFLPHTSKLLADQGAQHGPIARVDRGLCLHKLPAAGPRLLMDTTARTQHLCPGRSPGSETQAWGNALVTPRRYTLPGLPCMKW